MNRATADPEHVESVKIMRIEPGDIIVARLATGTHPNAIERVQETLKERFPNNEVLIHTDDVDLSIARKGADRCAKHPDQFAVATDTQGTGHCSQCVEEETRAIHLDLTALSAKTWPQ